ncbi:MAG: radical SAM protein [Candidatus Riflebacteria bacterium]|nr:radical SAM protein [Candidatus Riflebacteria bacterium]
MDETGDTARLARSFLPGTAVLELTFRCNHACLFCSCPWFAPDGRFPRQPEMGVTDWRRSIARLCEMGVNNLAFTGGEPLLKEGLEELLEFAATCAVEHVRSRDGQLVFHQAPPKLYLLSNGQALTRPLLELCRRLDVALSLSLPGLATFAEHTGGGDPDPVLGWFQEARALGIRTTVGITVTRLNIDELYETIAAALLAGADRLLLNRFLPGGRGLANLDRLSLDLDQIQRMLLVAEEVLRSADRYGSVGTELPRCLLPSAPFERLHVGTTCSAAAGFFTVGRGRTRPDLRRARPRSSPVLRTVCVRGRGPLDWS